MTDALGRLRDREQVRETMLAEIHDQIEIGAQQAEAGQLRDGPEVFQDIRRRRATKPWIPFVLTPAAAEDIQSVDDRLIEESPAAASTDAVKQGDVVTSYGHRKSHSRPRGTDTHGLVR